MQPTRAGGGSTSPTQRFIGGLGLHARIVASRRYVALGVELQAHAMRQRDAAARRLHDIRNRRKRRLAIGVERRRGAIVVAHDHLVHALGDGEVRDRVVEIEQPIDFGVDGVCCSALGRRVACVFGKPNG